MQEQRAVKQDVVEIYSDLSVSVRQTSALVQAYNESCIQRRRKVEYALRIVYLFVVSGKFHDGQSVASCTESGSEMQK